MPRLQSPPIIFISSDQHRADSLGCAGHPCVRTPHLDKLAIGGLRFDRAYVDCPVCVPQRTTWITGIKSHTYGMPEYSETFRVERSPEDMLGALMTQAGYETALIGKTHWHTDPSFDGGFETVIRETQLAEQIQAETGRPGCNFSGIGSNEINPGPTHLPPHLYSTDWLVDRAIERIDGRDLERPLFLWLSLTDPHPPNTIHEPYYSMYDRSEVPSPVCGDWTVVSERPYAEARQRERMNYPRMGTDELRKARGVYYGKITNIDHQLGRVFGKLQSEGLFEDAWIVYTSDHGEFLGDHELVGKRSFLEASARVPLIVRPPRGSGCEPGRVSDGLVALDDLLPTFCDIAGVDTPDDVTGRSWLPLLEGDVDSLHAFQHGNIAGSHMYHDGRYKYLYSVDDGSELLFDVANDPDDLRDLSKDADLCKQYRAALLNHLKEEGHPHCVDGDLLNEGKILLPLNRMRAETPNGWGAIGEGCWPV